MAKVTGLRNWRNGEVINARDYVYERNQVTDALNTNDDTLIDHETRITTAEGDITALEGRMTTEEANVDTLQSDVNTAESDIDSLEGRMDTAESDIDTLQSDVSTLQGQGLDTRLTQAESDIDDIENTLPIKADLIDGKIPQSQLPSYVDDILEVYVRAGSTEGTSDWLSLTNGGAALTPEAGKIYVIISAGDFEGKTYRWAGSVYSPVGDIALGETAATAFPGDRGLAVETQGNILNTAVNIAGQVNTQIPYWNSTNSRFESDPQLTFNPALNRLVAYQALIQNNFYTETISTANGSPSANIALSSTGTTISRNINDTNAPLKVNKVQGNWQHLATSKCWCKQVRS
jgi:hypothetical protein